MDIAQEQCEQGTGADLWLHKGRKPPTTTTTTTTIMRLSVRSFFGGCLLANATAANATANATAAGAVAQIGLAICDAADATQWWMYTATSGELRNGGCLAANGTTAHMEACTGAATQQWQFNLNSGQIQSIFKVRCLEAPESLSADANMQLAVRIGHVWGASFREALIGSRSASAETDPKATDRPIQPRSTDQPADRPTGRQRAGSEIVCRVLITF